MVSGVGMVAGSRHNLSLLHRKGKWAKKVNNQHTYSAARDSEVLHECRGGRVKLEQGAGKSGSLCRSGGCHKEKDGE